MKYLLSLPENIIKSFPDRYRSNKDFFPCSDPKEGKVGSGGGTSWILSNFWQVIDKAARDFDTQVIATTHGYECIREAHKAFSASDSYDFLFHRLDRIGDRVESATYDREALEAAIKAEFEVR